MVDRLREWASQRGYSIAWGSGSIVDAVKREISQRRSSSEIDTTFFDDELKPIMALAPADLKGSILLIAKPCPAYLIHFDVDDKSIDGLLPPTYFRYSATFEEVRLDLLKNCLVDVQLEHLSGPLKALANRLGLMAYGRNNIGYVKGIGSYFQLCGFVTDAVLPEESAVGNGKRSLLDDCENCGICTGICPTGAITDERVLLHAEKCLTYANETAGEWPDWVGSHAHNTIVGCLECQRVCPANPEMTVEDSGLHFSAAETQQLLCGEPIANGYGETGMRFKLAWLGQPTLKSVLGRNLKALMKSRGLKHPVG